MIAFERPIAFLDTETTGVDIAKDRIIEIAVIKWFPDGRDREGKTYRFNPGIPIPASATEVHGISDADVKDCEPFSRYASGLIEYLEGCDIGGFNSNRYDIPLLLEELKRAGKTLDLSNRRLIDVGNIYKAYEPRTLSAGVKLYLGKDHTEAHGAEADTIATIDIFEEQISRYFSDDKVIEMEEFETIANFGKKRLDLAGKFAYSEDGKKIILTFGKHKGEDVLLNYGFLNWMLAQDFTPDTKDYCKKFISQIPFR